MVDVVLQSPVRPPRQPGRFRSDRAQLHVRGHAPHTVDVRNPQRRPADLSQGSHQCDIPGVSSIQRLSERPERTGMRTQPHTVTATHRCHMSMIPSATDIRTAIERVRAQLGTAR
ncbi:hypothetical protein GCM10017586_26160 [Microbacterium imperiale]|uniref:Uncharacterized protein n=1 Tax=Microbacterium imperiale TaxID=33884 RepID=A0A9W6HJG2_9MICO|nr:hypothetical protein GCM10017544_29360 [Microbacterium imperiale]GLJ80933.1 hypothetical protein GCM10017586_26160 [Microbacterium imperiale]